MSRLAAAGFFCLGIVATLEFANFPILSAAAPKGKECHGPWEGFKGTAKNGQCSQPPAGVPVNGVWASKAPADLVCSNCSGSGTILWGDALCEDVEVVKLCDGTKGNPTPLNGTKTSVDYSFDCGGTNGNWTKDVDKNGKDLTKKGMEGGKMVTQYSWSWACVMRNCTRYDTNPREVQTKICGVYGSPNG